MNDVNINTKNIYGSAFYVIFLGDKLVVYDGYAPSSYDWESYVLTSRRIDHESY